MQALSVNLKPFCAMRPFFIKAKYIFITVSFFSGHAIIYPTLPDWLLQLVPAIQRNSLIGVLQTGNENILDFHFGRQWHFSRRHLLFIRTFISLTHNLFDNTLSCRTVCRSGSVLSLYKIQFFLSHGMIRKTFHSRLSCYVAKVNNWLIGGKKLCCKLSLLLHRSLNN